MANQLSEETLQLSQLHEKTKGIGRVEMQHVKATIVEKDTEILSLKAQIKNHSSKIRSLEADSGSAKMTIRDRDLQNQRLHDDLTQAQIAAGRLSVEIQQLSQLHEKMKRIARGELRDVSAMIVEKDTDISSLKAQIVKDSSRIYSLEADLAQLSAIWKTIDRSDDSIHAYKRQIRLKSRLIDELRHQVTQLSALASTAITVIQSAGSAQNLDTELKLMDKRFDKLSIIRDHRESSGQ